MGKNIFRIAAIISVIIFSGCNEKAKLARQIEGTWTGTPTAQNRQTTGIPETTTTKTIRFDIGPKKTDGKLHIEELVSISYSKFTDLAEGHTPLLSISASGTISADGTWTASDDDEIIIYIDPQSIKAEVDTSSVALGYDTLSPNSTADIAAIKPAATEDIRQKLIAFAGTEFSNINKIDDIKVINDIMSCEIGNSDLTFKRLATAD